MVSAREAARIKEDAYVGAIMRDRDDLKRKYTRLLEAVEPLLAAAEKATPAPWENDPKERCGSDGDWGVYQAESGGDICFVGDAYPRGDNHPFENMVFIATARNTAAALRDLLGPTGGQA